MVGAYGGHGGGDERLSADFVSFIEMKIQASPAHLF